MSTANPKITGNGKEPKTCAQCGDQYDTYTNAATSKFCSGACRAAYSKAHPRQPLPPPDNTDVPGAGIVKQPENPYTPPPLNKMNGETGVPLYFYQEKMALINKLETKCDKLENELKTSQNKVHELTKDLAVKDVTSTKPEGLGAVMTPEFFTALVQNPESIKIALEGIKGFFTGNPQAQIGSADQHPLLVAISKQPQDVQERAMYVFAWYLANPLRLNEMYNGIQAAAAASKTG